MNPPGRERAEDPSPSVGEACANCGTRLVGAYCHACGQEADGPPESLRAFLAESARDILHFRSRTLLSLGRLASRPGELTAAYFEGRRVRYTSPVKIYLLAATAFFLVNEYRPFVTIDEENRVVSSLSAADVVAGFGGEIERLEAEGVPRALVWERFRWTVRRSLPQFMIGSILLFALALALFSPRRPALRHVVFSLHWTGFFLLAMSLERLLPRPDAPVDLVALAFAVALLVHLTFALRRSYGHPWPRAVASALGLFAVFNTILALWVIAVVTYAFELAA